MTKAQGETRLDVSIYLVKAAAAPLVQKVLLLDTAEAQLLRDDIPEGRFLALHAEASPPKWAEFVSTLLADGGRVDLSAQAPGGLLWVPHGGKQFVFTFGYAHARLKDEWLEPEFGKKVALGVIPQGQVVEVRAEQVFAKWHTSSERAPRASAVREFGFESDRDLVSAVEGVPSPTYTKLLGGKVRGGTAFKAAIYFSQLLNTLDIIAERFDSGAYKKIWPQIDNLVAVRDPALVKILDAKLDKVLAAPNAAGVVALAAPARRSDDKPYPQHFAIGRMSKFIATAPYLLFGNWQAYLRTKGSSPTLTSSLETTVHFLDENKVEVDSCAMYQCFGTELDYNGKSFILSSGIWYEAKLQFVTETNKLIGMLAIPKHGLVPWNNVDDEGTYNENATLSDKSLWLFDKKLINFGGGRSRFEFCDIMHLGTKTLYFVKQPSGSASVSHLCEQVRRTVENFFSTDPGFRGKLSANIIKQSAAQPVNWLASRPQRQDWTLCLVSMGKAATAFPFFAKCGVARLVREMEQGGYNITFLSV